MLKHVVTPTTPDKSDSLRQPASAGFVKIATSCMAWRRIENNPECRVIIYPLWNVPQALYQGHPNDTVLALATS